MFPTTKIAKHLFLYARNGSQHAFGLLLRLMSSQSLNSELGVLLSYFLTGYKR